jgi:hypothetical protein
MVLGVRARVCVRAGRTMQAKDLRRHLRPHFENYATGHTPAWYNYGGTVLTSLALNFYASSFGLLSVEATWRVWSSTYFYGVAGTALFLAVPFLIALVPGHGKALKAHKEAIAARAAKAALATKAHTTEVAHVLQEAAKAAVAKAHTGGEPAKPK